MATIFASFGLAMFAFLPQTTDATSNFSPAPTPQRKRPKAIKSPKPIQSPKPSDQNASGVKPPNVDQIKIEGIDGESVTSQKAKSGTKSSAAGKNSGYTAQPDLDASGNSRKKSATKTHDRYSNMETNYRKKRVKKPKAKKN